MNKTLVSCYTSVFDVSLLTSRQLIIITIVNMILMSSNVIANAVVIYILIKTGQISNITSKLIFMLSASDLLQGFISQNLLTATFYETNCSVNDASRFLSVFLSHLSNYTIVIMGVDRYLRMKHFVNFKIMWTSRVVLKLIFLAFCIALLKALLITVGLLRGQKYAVYTIYIALDGIILGTIIILQIKTISTSNPLHDESIATASGKISKRVTKLSMRIMLFLCFFLTSHLVMSVLREIIQDQLNVDDRSIIEFISFISLVLVYVNPSANAISFLMTNMKARRYMANIRQCLKRSLKRMKILKEVLLHAME